MQSIRDPAANAGGMKYAHWFGLIAELVLGCIASIALFAAPFVLAVKILIGAIVLLFVQTMDGLSSESEHQAQVVLKTLACLPVLTEEKLKDPSYDLLKGVTEMNAAIHESIEDGSVRVLFRLVKYVAWLAAGWAVNHYFL